MPRAQANGIEIEYDTFGSGPPLLLIYGYGGSRRSWRREFLDALAADFRVTTFDNRDTGGSTRPPPPWSLADMARDAIGLLDALGLRRTHLLGLSMGGMIAQEVALRSPRRIERLVLSDTHCGARTAAPSPPWVAEAFAIDERLSPREQAAKSRPTVYSERFLADHGDWLDQEFDRLEPFRSPPATFAHHSEAIRGWDSFDRLPKIKQPTLILHGTEDVLVLPENAKVLAERIPDARLELIDGCGHIPMTERPLHTAALIRDFLLGGDAGTASAPGKPA